MDATTFLTSLVASLLAVIIIGLLFYFVGLEIFIKRVDKILFSREVNKDYITSSHFIIELKNICSTWLDILMTKKDLDRLKEESKDESIDIYEDGIFEDASERHERLKKLHLKMNSQIFKLVTIINDESDLEKIEHEAVA